jgi:hypothetical protein
MIIHKYCGDGSKSFCSTPHLERHEHYERSEIVHHLTGKLFLQEYLVTRHFLPLSEVVRTITDLKIVLAGVLCLKTLLSFSEVYLNHDRYENLCFLIQVCLIEPMSNMGVQFKL